MKCPKCGCEEFEVTCDTHDTVTYEATIDDECIDLEASLKDYCGDTEYWGNAECLECGANINIATGEIIEDGIELTLFTVMLLYPDPTNTETFLAQVYGENAKDALVAAKEMAVKANEGTFDPDDFFTLGIFRGHMVDLTDGRGCVGDA